MFKTLLQLRRRNTLAMGNENYKLSPAADKDLDEIFDYTEEEFGIDQAAKYLTELEEVFIQLFQNPLIGRTRNEIKRGLRNFVKSSHVVFYRPMKSHVRIVRVLHGSRDFVRFF